MQMLHPKIVSNSLNTDGIKLNNFKQQLHFDVKSIPLNKFIFPLAMYFMRIYNLETE